MSITETAHAGAFLLSEAPGALSRATVVVDVPAGTTYEPGTVLGKLSGTGHYVPYDDSASDGSETAAAILVTPLTNDTLAPTAPPAAVIDSLAEVRSADLVWGNGVDEDGGLVDLAAQHIKARD